MSSAALAARRHVARSSQSITSFQTDKQQPPAKAVTKPASLARRLLFPHLHADADLPPLLVSPAATLELNDELYNFIAIALRAFVHPWWMKITRYDKEFLPDITRVLTVVIRSLEARIIRTDLSPLILRDLPSLLSQHYQDYRNAQSKLHTSYASGGAASLPQLFHQSQPHMAVSADGTVDDAYIRQAIDGVLASCLPWEDYDADPERFIVREIIVKVVLGGVFPRLTQPWFIHQQILNILGPDRGKEKLVESTEAEIAQSQRPSLHGTSPNSFSFHSLVIFFLSAIRSISGACLALMHAYRHAIGTIKKVNQSTAFSHVSSEQDETECWRGATKSTLPGTLNTGVSHSEDITVQQPVPMLSPPPSPPPLRPGLSPAADHQLQHNYVHPALHLLTTFLTPSPSLIYPPRSTPLAITYILTLLLTPFTSILSRLLPHLLYTHLFSPSSLITILQSARNALFPGGYPAVPPPDPTPDEQVELRKELARHLLALIPTPLQLVFGTNAEMRLDTVDKALLEPLSSAECNTHLMVFILDLILLSLFPEMGVSVPGDLAEGVRSPVGSLDSMVTDMTPPRPDSRPP